MVDFSSLLISTGQNIVSAINGLQKAISGSAPGVTEVDTGTGLTGGPVTSVGTVSLASAPPWTFKTNNSGVSAPPTDVTIDGLTAKATPTGADEVPIWDAAASQTKKASLSSVISVSASAVVPPAGRLTPNSGVPVPITSSTGATIYFYTPYIGQFVPLWNGSAFVMTDIGGELSQTTTDTTKSPAAVVANSLYDLFVWNDAGTFRCTRGPTWASGGGSNTVRGTGAGSTELIRQNGILLNKNAITNGPAASRGTYVGTIASNGSSTIDFIFGSAASGGGQATLNVWNAYNRREVNTTVTDNGVSYAYGTATLRQKRASATNKISFISGLAEDGQILHVKSKVSVPVANDFVVIGIGLDSTTSAVVANLGQSNVAGGQMTVAATWMNGALLGQHSFNSLEQGDGVNNETFDLDSADFIDFSFLM